MKNTGPVIIGTAAILAAIATTIANANGWFAGGSYLVPRFYLGTVFLLILALLLAVYNSRREQKPKPLIVPVRYGAAPMAAGKHMMGYHGLIVANHSDEPAYDSYDHRQLRMHSL